MIPETPGIALLNQNPFVRLARGRARTRLFERSIGETIPPTNAGKNGMSSNTVATAIGNRAPDKLLLSDND